MPLSGPLKPWTFYLSRNFPFIDKVGNKNVLIVCLDTKGAYGFLMNSNQTGQRMNRGGKVKFSPFVTRQASRNPAILKCHASLTQGIQPELRRNSFIACDRLYDLSHPLQSEMFAHELFTVTTETIQAVIRAVGDCPALSPREKEKILTFAISTGYHCKT